MSPAASPPGVPSDAVELDEAIHNRRSVRRFAPGDVPPRLVRDLVAAACAAPAPHHSRPWRFVDVTSAARPRLADAMASDWQADTGDPAPGAAAIDRSRAQLVAAPLLLLACLEMEHAREWPDERRRAAERDMYVQSLGAALQNLLLAAHGRGLAGYLKGAPLFCADAIASALDLPSGWEPAFLVLLGYPEDGASPPPRETLDPGDFLASR
ncbi:MAG: nitroreductase family protein [Dehalococcoidia bacterium]